MVSTRGIKTLFEEGETVLCYEQNPKKVKVLYEAKVLFVEVSIDKETGKKVTDYHIHFNAWNARHDTVVKEETIVEDNAENRLLKDRLDEESVKILEQEVQRKKRKSAETTEPRNNRQKGDDWSDISSESSDSEDDLTDAEDKEDNNFEFSAKIPDSLMAILASDWLDVYQSGMVYQLPADPNVTEVLESFVKEYSSKMSAIYTESLAIRIENAVQYADGIRILFDMLFKSHSMYPSERLQYSDLQKNPGCKEYLDRTRGQPVAAVIKKEVVEHAEDLPPRLTRSTVQSDEKSKRSVQQRRKIRRESISTVGLAQNLLTGRVLRRRRQTAGSGCSTDIFKEPAESESCFSNSDAGESAVALGSSLRRASLRSAPTSPPPPVLQQQLSPLQAVTPQTDQQFSTVTSVKKQMLMKEESSVTGSCCNSSNSSVKRHRQQQQQQQQQARNNFVTSLLSDFKLYPQSQFQVSTDNMPPPSHLYGAQHLLRFLSSFIDKIFPKMLECSHHNAMPKHHRSLVNDITENLIEYLEERSHVVFQPALTLKYEAS